MQSLGDLDKPSFFDDAGSHEDFSFWKQISITTRKLSDVKHTEGILFKKSKRTSFWKSRYYILYDDRLAYFKHGRDKQETAYCLIQNMRLEKLKGHEKDEHYGFRLVHNKKSIELYARSAEVQDKWVSKLKQFCVQTDYAASYSNIKMIGEGSFAKVYLVKRKSDGMELAAKTFDKSLLAKVDKAKASLINEINIMRKLENDNIIKLYDVYENESYIYLILELLHGGELFERIIKKGIYTEKDAAILMEKMLSALDCMHSKNMMHRDIKPENLILKDMENNYDVKIADFGLATYVTQGELLFKRCGTPGYVAPEILADEKYDQKVDVFSAGVILYILLTGGSPFYGKSYNEILIKNKYCEIKFNFKESDYQISNAAIDLLKKMLAKDPKQRISSKEALNHPWIIAKGVVEVQEKPQVTMLSSAQENMKRFQENHRFNVKNIKPKDLDNVNAMERSLHCPSPIINGRITTVVESKYAGGQMAVPGKKSMFVSTNESDSDIIEEADDGDQIDEKPQLGSQIDKYKNNFSLTNKMDTINNTPQMKPKPVDKVSMTKARNIQGNLLGLIKNTEKEGGLTVTSYYKDTKKVADVRNNLMGLH